MKLEDHVRAAIVDELRRQSEAGEGGLRVDTVDGNTLVVEGPVNLDELAMAIVGSLAGGP